MDKKLKEALSIVSSYFTTHAFQPIEKDFETKIMKDISDIEGIDEYLRQTLANDIHREFNSDDSGRDMAKGAFLRTAYFYDKINKARLTK